MYYKFLDLVSLGTLNHNNFYIETEAKIVSHLPKEANL